ncbi:MAG: arsenate reductase ArsC [Deltaproteobacteria bacterium]|nr:arsenate reductase ArsC [Deltaproteobacteria bacterium]
MPTICFVCDYNACRSQMGEALGRVLLPEQFAVCSAGLYPGTVNTLTTEVMQEIGVDLSSQTSKTLEAVPMDRMDCVVVLAEPALEPCKAHGAKQIVYWPFSDPLRAPGDDAAVKDAVRQVRDTLHERILTLPTLMEP